MLFESKEKFETKKEIVNSAIRICIECGSLAVLIDNHLVFCNDCNSKFKIKDDDQWLLHVEDYVIDSNPNLLETYASMMQDTRGTATVTCL